MNKLLCTLIVIFGITSSALAQTYTWTGNTDSDWGTSTNWSPNGVPDSVSTVIIGVSSGGPVLASDSKVGVFHLDSGTMDLAGYTLNIHKSIKIYGGDVTAGHIISDQQSYWGDKTEIKDAVLNCSFDIRTPQAEALRSVFNDTLKVDQWAGWTKNWGENVFNEHVHLIQNGKDIRLGGVNGPDTLNGTFLLEMESAVTNWYLSGSQGVYYGDDIILRNRSTSKWMRNLGDVEVDGNITVGTSSSGAFYLGETGYPITITAGHGLAVDTMGFDVGILYLYDITQAGSAESDLSSLESTVKLSNCTFGGKLITSDTENTELLAGNEFGEVDLGNVVVWNGAVFNGKADITATGTTKGNVFHDSTNITVSNNLIMGYVGKDTAWAPLSVTTIGAGGVVLASTGPSYFADNVTLTNSSTSNGVVYGSSGGTVTYAQDVIVNQTSGLRTRFYGSNCTVDGSIRTGKVGITDGDLYIEDIVQTSSDSILLRNVDDASVVLFDDIDINGHLLLEGGTPSMSHETFGGGVTLECNSIPPTYCDFYGDTYFTKLGGTNNLTYGNTYHGNLYVKNESNTNYLYMGVGNWKDTVMGDLTLINDGTAELWFASSAVIPVGGDVTIDGSEEVKIGHSGAGDYLHLIGSGNQTISIGDDVDHQVYRMKVDKTNGNVILEDSLIISHELRMDNGRIICQEAGMVTLHDGISMSGISDTTYVEGKVKKVGDDAFTFPVGRQGHYRPISISAPSATTDEFVGAYYNLDVSELYDITSKDSTLTSISTNEYWTLERTNGSSDETVTLSWDETSCDISDIGNLKVAAWSADSAKWVDYGSGTTTGDTLSGTVASSTDVTEYMVFALASDSTWNCTPCRADAGEDTWAWEGLDATIGVACDSSGMTYSWSPTVGVVDSTACITQATISSTTTFQLTVDNGNGCFASDDITVTGRFIPNWENILAEGDSADLNFVKEVADAFFKANDNTDVSKEFKRFYRFWYLASTRSGTFGDTTRGLHHMRNAILGQWDSQFCPESSNPYTANWSSIGDLNADLQAQDYQNSGLVQSIAVNPNDHEDIFIGTRASGVWRSTDGGNNWFCISEEFSYPSTGVGQLDFGVDGKLYAGTGFANMYSHALGLGLLRFNLSSNLWEEIPGLSPSAVPPWTVGDLFALHPTDPDIILARHGKKLVRYSGPSNQVETVLSLPPGHGLGIVLFDEQNPQYAYATTTNKDALDGGARFYRSSDSGQTWNVVVIDAIHQGSNSAIGLSLEYKDVNLQAFTGQLYASLSTFSSSPELAIYESTDHGATWQLWHTYDKSHSIYNFDILAINRNGNTEIYHEEVKHYVCDDSDYTSTVPTGIGNGTLGAGLCHVDTRDFALFLDDNDEIGMYHANDGGVGLNDLENRSVSPLPITGLQTNEIFGISNLEREFVSSNRRLTPNFVVSGSQDNNFFRFENGTWSRFGGGDGYAAEQSNVNPTIGMTGNNGGGNDPARFQYTSNAFSGLFNSSSNDIGDHDPDGFTRFIEKPSGKIYTASSFKPPLDAAVFALTPEEYPGTNIQVDQVGNPIPAVIADDGLYAVDVCDADEDVMYVGYRTPTWGGAFRPLLYRTDDGGQTWDFSFAEDLEDLYESLPVMDIAVNPSDGNEVWVCFGNYSEDNGEANNRVYHGVKIGTNWVWEDISSGLPNVPCNRIEYQRGTDDGLYAGTDLGVYFRKSGDAKWYCYNDGAVPSIVSGLKINYCTSELRISTFGRGMMKSPLAVPSAQALIIDSNLTWDEINAKFLVMPTDVVVKDGATLTISGLVNMVKDKKIIVEPGAKLHVDGGTITNMCGDNWKGIEVWGDPNEGPSFAEQGYVLLTDGATIEHAIKGVYLGKEGNCCSHSGGIVRAIGGSTPDDRITFRNCWKAAEFMTYNHSSISWFTNTDFICDAPMNDPSYEVGGERVGTSAHVTIWDQEGIFFKDCRFENAIDYNDENGDPQSFPEALRGLGILTVDGDIEVVSTDPDNDKRTEFVGLTRAIDVHRSNWLEGVMTVDGALIENCIEGILDEGSIMDRVTNCEFNMPQPLENTVDNTGFGVYMRDGLDHHVENNTFDKYGTERPFYAYVCDGPPIQYNIFQTGGNAKWNIFNNYFSATQAEDNNFNAEFLCNTYNSGNLYDWSINPQSQGSTLGPQGSNCDPNLSGRAGNVFNDTGNDHVNNWAQPFDYYYEMTGNQEPSVNSNYVNVNDWGCPPVGGGDPSCDIPASGGDPWFRLAGQDSTLDVLETERTDLIADLDSGYTDTLVAHLLDTNYSNATLVTELLQWSFLSDTVLKEACNRHPFFKEADFQDIILANSPVTREVWPTLDSALSKVKAAYADTIRGAQSTDTLRTVRTIQREEEQTRTQRFNSITDIVALQTDADSIPDSTYAMIRFLADTLPEVQWKMMAVDVCMSLDTLTWARDVLDSIPLITNEDSAYHDFQDLALDLKEAGKTWLEMDSTQNATLNALASDSTFMMSRAQAVQMLLGDSTMIRIPEQIPGNPSWRVAGTEEDQGQDEPPAEASEFKVYPNPFSNRFALEYVLEEEATDVRMEIRDLAGRLIRQQRLTNVKAGVEVFDMGPCNGIYILSVIADERRVHQEKLLCVE